ncbi:hypothetical protein SAMN04487919_12645 [Bacillus sp. ok061]|nr:hypothetical protein SAMN04487919_12645 [Bacillus sp. ok061]
MYVELLIKKGAFFLVKDNDVINIKYKQMDKDPEIKEITNEIERIILGDKAVGLLEHLGLTAGKVQKFLDEQWEKEFDELLEENKNYIFEETRNRSINMFQMWMKEMKGTEIKFTEEIIFEKLDEFQRKAELQVIEELVEARL